MTEPEYTDLERRFRAAQEIKSKIANLRGLERELRGPESKDLRLNRNSANTDGTPRPSIIQCILPLEPFEAAIANWIEKELAFNIKRLQEF